MMHDDVAVRCVWFVCYRPRLLLLLLEHDSDDKRHEQFVHAPDDICY